MAAANTFKSAQHALEALVLGANTGTGTAGGPSVNRYTITATIPTAGANVNTNVTATANGVKLGDVVIVAPQTAILHQQTPTAYVSAADTITLCAAGDGTGFTGAAQVFNVLVFKQS